MKKIIYISILLLNTTLYAQLGPGGIGNTTGTSNLVLWLIADKTTSAANSLVNIWEDQSGYGYHFTSTNGVFLDYQLINGYRSLYFNGSFNYFEKTFEANLNSANFTLFSVNKIFNNRSKNTIISSCKNAYIKYGFSLGTNSAGNYLGYTHGVWTNWLTTSIQNIPYSWVLETIIFEKTIFKKKFYIRGQLKSDLSSNYYTNNSNPMRIGADTKQSSPSDYLRGNISEIIMYKISLSTVERIIIDNYISAKYSTYLLSNNYYTQDDTTNGDFDHSVAGIGQAIDGSNHINSQGTGIVKINNPSTLSNDDFLFWGEETKTPTYTFTTSNQYTERIDTKWRVSKRNDLGTVSVHIKETDINVSGMTACASLKLIVSNDSNFVTKTSYDMVLSGGIYTATNVNFTDGDYFTLEYFDQIVIDGTKFYNGSGISNVPSTADGCYKLLVKNTADGSLPLTENCVVREVEVETGGKLVVNTGIDFEITNGLLLNGDIRMIGNASLNQTHAGVSQVTGNGKLYIDRTNNLTNVYQSGFWSSPVVTSGNTYTIGSTMKDGTSPTSANSTPVDINFVAGYDGATTTPISISKYWLAKLTNSLNWNIHRNENTLYNPTEGYNMKSSGANQQNFTFVGKPNDGDYTSIIVSGNSSLLGNPYPSAMDANKFLISNNTIFNTLYFWDGSVDNSNSHIRNDYAGGYATYNGVTGVAFNGGQTPNGIIAIGQGFFVDAITSGTIVFNNNHRIYNLSAPIYTRQNTTPILRIGLDFSIDNNKTFHRQLAVGFNGATNEFEENYDAIMYDMNPSDFALKVFNNSNDFVITGIENYNENIEIPLHVKLDQQRNITFSIDTIENFSLNNIYLKDNLTNRYHNLQNNINLVLNEGDYNNRFSIVFRNSLASINHFNNNNTIKIIDKKNSIDIESNRIIKKITIYNTLGQTIINKSVNNSYIRITNQLFDKGQILFIKVGLENGEVKTTKILKR